MVQFDHLSGFYTAAGGDLGPKIVPGKSSEQNSLIQCTSRGLQDFLHVVSSDGTIVYASESGKMVVGYKPTELLGRFVTDFIHPDDLGVFTTEFNEALLHGNPVRFIYRFRKPDNDWIILESQCNIYHDGTPNSVLHHHELIVMARPYLSKGRALFDSFLEHKITHERLMRQMTQLENEERELETPQDTQKTEVVDGVFIAYAQSQQTRNQQGRLQVQVEFACLPADPEEKNVSYTKAEGKCSPVVGDAGIPIPRNKKSGKAVGSRARKKRNATETYICMVCGTFESPEWRAGPGGPKTLCNGCGLRWSKGKRSRVKK